MYDLYWLNYVGFFSVENDAYTYFHVCTLRRFYSLCLIVVFYVYIDFALYIPCTYLQSQTSLLANVVCCENDFK